MQNTSKIIPILAVLALTGCMGPNMDFGPSATTTNYTEPSASGLSAVKPYPTPASVCQVIRENDAIRVAPNDGTFLVACPKHEAGALMDLTTQGATVVGHARHWTVLSVATDS